MSRHCPCNKVQPQLEGNQAKDKSEEYKKVKNLKTKNLKSQNILACDITTNNITAESATFTDLSSISLSVSNLNVTTLNGRNLFCDDEFKISGVITPVEYVNGEPIQPANTGNFDQRVVDELWTLNRLANGFANLDAADTRYKNYLLQNFYGCTGCPNFPPTGCVFNAQQTALFTGSVSGSAGVSGSNNVLNVTEILPANSITGMSGSSQIGTVQIGQRVYPETAETYFVIREQLSGAPGGTGTYRVDNEFNSVINLESQRMLALRSNGLEECALIPLRIYGVETIPYSSANLGVSGMSGMSGMSGLINGCGTTVVEAVNYNINIANKVLDTRVALVYLQVGWIDSNNQVVIQGLSVDTKQFDLSILSFGEQMNNNFLIPDNIKPDPVTAVLQIAVYVEDGLEVLIPEAGTPLPLNQQNGRAVTSRAVVAAPGQATNYTVSFSTLSVSNGTCAVSAIIQLETFIEPNLLSVVPVITSGIPNILNPGASRVTNDLGVIQDNASGFYYYEFGYTGATGTADLYSIGESANAGTTVPASPGVYQGSIGTATRLVFNQPAQGVTTFINRHPISELNISPNCIRSGKVLLTNGKIGGQRNLIGVYNLQVDTQQGTYNLESVRPLQVQPGQRFNGSVVIFPLYIV